MGWNDRDDRMIDLYDEASGLEEYYAELTGKDIHIVVENYDDFYIQAPRTNGKEYFSSLRDADKRLRQLYEDILVDDGDYSDPYEGL